VLENRERVRPFERYSRILEIQGHKARIGDDFRTVARKPFGEAQSDKFRQTFVYLSISRKQNLPLFVIQKCRAQAG
jgi:hypothetical protein